MAAHRAKRLKQVIQSVARIFTEASPQQAAAMGRSYRSTDNIPAQSTGLRTLDRALDVGGLPIGKITEMIGPTVTPISGGPAGIVARIGAKVQRQQEIVAIIDLSRSFDVHQAERCGLVAPHLLLTQPDTFFSALSSLEQASRNARFTAVVMGSVNNLLSGVELESLQLLLRRLHLITRSSESAFLFLTTPSEEDAFSPLNYPAGFPLSEIADVRLWVQNESWSHKESLATAYKATLTVIKNRFGVAGKGADIRIKFDFGQKL